MTPKTPELPKIAETAKAPTLIDLKAPLMTAIMGMNPRALEELERGDLA